MMMYRISGNFWYLKIFKMEKFDSGNFQKGQPFVKIFTPENLLAQKLLVQKCRNEWKYHTSLNTHAWALLVFLSRRFGTGVETRQTFHRHLAECIKTTRLLHKDYLAGYSHKKTAVINEHYTLNSLLMLWSLWNEGLLYVEYRNC